VERARVEELLTRAVGEQVRGLRDWRDALAGLGDRVSALEAAVHELRASLPGEVGAEVRANLHDVVSTELATAALILRREIDDLARMIRTEFDARPTPDVIDLTQR
jgi:hypothetical protein